MSKDQFIALFKSLPQSPLPVNEDLAFITAEVPNIPMIMVELSPEEQEIVTSQQFNSDIATKRANNFAQYGQERAPTRGRGRGQRGARGGARNNNNRRRNDDMWDDPSQGGGVFENGVFTTSGVPQSSAMWHYKDPQGDVQGPFAAIEMTEWFEAGYFAGNLLVRRADVEEDFHSTKGWLELAEYMRHLNAQTGQHMGVTFFGPPLVKPKVVSPEVVSPVQRQANWQQPAQVVSVAMWKQMPVQKPINQHFEGLSVQDHQHWNRSSNGSSQVTSPIIQSVPVSQVQQPVTPQLQSVKQVKAIIPPIQQPSKVVQQTQQPSLVQNMQYQQDLLKDARKSLEPLSGKIDVRALLDLLSVMTDPESIVEVIHDAIGPYHKLVNPQLVAEQVIKARNPNASVPRPQVTAAQHAAQRQPQQKESGFTEVVNKKKQHKGRKNSQDVSVTGVNGREVIGAAGLKK